MKKMFFSDTEELSHQLQHTNVSAMQTSAGRFGAQWTSHCVAGWSVQCIDMLLGASTCSGDSPLDSYAFVVPRKASAPFRLLGSPIDPSSLGLYAPGSEHADISSAGAGMFVVVPPAVFQKLMTDRGGVLPRSGSRHARLPSEKIDALRAALEDLDSSMRLIGPGVLAASIERCLEDELTGALSAVLETAGAEKQRGRPALPRPTILRDLRARLDNDWSEPLFLNELCSELGVSEPTLRRIFLDWYGVPPARFLLLRRYHLARRMLRNGTSKTVTEAAQTYGFWNLSRFAATYRLHFGEPPSSTLHKARSRRR